MAKKSRQYWIDRYEALEDLEHRSAVRLYQELEREFNRTQREILRLIEQWYDRLAVNNEDVSPADARKFISDAELEEFVWEVEEYIEYGKEHGANPQWRTRLENASARVHINRLDLAKMQVENRLEVLYQDYNAKLANFAEQAITSTYYHSMHEIQKGFNVGWKIQAFDERRLEKIMQFPWSADNKTFSQNVWDNKEKLVNNLHSELTQMTLRGGKPDEAINNISKLMDTSKSSARRLVMTESSYFHSSAQQEVYDELDVEQYQIVATLDNKTSKICRDMDMEIFDMKDYEVGVTANPFHSYCRTVTVPSFDDDFAIGERAARGGDGKTYYVPGDMSYHDWYEEYVA